MFPSSRSSSSFGFPDVCKVPSSSGPIPIPYPNIGSTKQGTQSSKKVGMQCSLPDCNNLATASLPGPVPRPVCLECYKKTTGRFPLPAGKLSSKLPKSSGDEAGTMGGLMSGQQMGPARFTKHSSKVKVEGAKLPSLLDYHQGRFININP